SMVMGLMYIIAVEGLLATFPTVLRRLTVMFHFRVLTMHWLNPADGKSWGLDLDTAPSAQACVLTILGVGAAFALLSAVITMRRGFRGKRPGGGWDAGGFQPPLSFTRLRMEAAVCELGACSKSCDFCFLASGFSRPDLGHARHQCED